MGKAAGTLHGPEVQDLLESRPGVEYNYRQGRHELTLYCPDGEALEEARRGACDFRVRLHEEILVLLFRFGTGRWWDATYQWHLVPEEERVLPEPGTDPVLLHVTGTDLEQQGRSFTRTLKLEGELRKGLEQAILWQSRQPWAGQEIYLGKVLYFYLNQPEPEEMAQLWEQ